MHYLYQHIRVDTSEVFYVGIGTRSFKNGKIKTNYDRAKSRHHRTRFWHSIVKKTEYRIEILVESDDYELIKKKEKELITFYGRRDLGTGTLCNLSEGGGGVKGWKHSPECIKRFSTSQSKPILQFSLSGKLLKYFRTKKEAEKSTGVSLYNITGCLDGATRLSSKGFFWMYEEEFINNKLDKLKYSVERYLKGEVRNTARPIELLYNAVTLYEKFKADRPYGATLLVATILDVPIGSLKIYIRNKESIKNRYNKFNTEYKEFEEYITIKQKEYETTREKEKNNQAIK